MSVIANLDVNLRGNTAGLDKAFDKSEKKVKDFDDKTRKQVEKNDRKATQSQGQILAKVSGVVSDLSGMAAAAVKGVTSGTLSGLVGGLSSAASTAATLIGGPIAGAVVGAMGAVAGVVGDLVEKIASRIGEALSKLSQLSLAARQLGSSTRALAELNFAGQAAGIGDMTAALKGFASVMHLAGRGEGGAGLALRELGIQGKELLDLPLDQKLARIADGIARTGNAGDRLRLASAFGMADALPLLEQGAAGIAKLRSEAQALGVGDPAAAKAAREAGLAWSKFNASLDAVWNTFAGALAPIVKDVAAWMSDAGMAVGRWVNENAQFFRIWIGHAAKMLAFFAQIGGQILSVVSGFSLLSSALGEGGLTWDKFKTYAITAMAVIQVAADNWKLVLGLAFDYVQLKVVELGNDVVHVFTNVIPKAVESLGNAFEKIKNGDFKGAFADVGKDLAAAMKRAPTQFEQDLIKRIGKASNKLKDDLQRKLDEMMKGPGGGDETPDGKQRQGLPIKAAAMEYGSKEAFSVIYGTQDAQAKALNVANQQLNELRNNNKALDRIVQALKAQANLQPARL